jgi:hypothetical protein
MWRPGGGAASEAMQKGGPGLLATPAPYRSPMRLRVSSYPPGKGGRPSSKFSIAGPHGVPLGAGGGLPEGIRSHELPTPLVWIEHWSE